MSSSKAYEYQLLKEEKFRLKLKLLFDFFGDIASIIVLYEGDWPCVYCAYCGDISLKKGSTFWISCANCHENMYCCIAHKKTHWKTHHSVCKVIKKK